MLIKKLLKLIQNIEREARASCDENAFLKADRALSKLNYLFHLNSKTNLVTVRKCVIHIICNIPKLV